jgi:hypothetical protein
MLSSPDRFIRSLLVCTIGLVIFYDMFRFAVDPTKMTLKPLNPALNTYAIGSQSVLSQYDIQTLNKAYSCEGGVTTNGGGNYLVGHT